MIEITKTKNYSFKITPRTYLRKSWIALFVSVIRNRTPFADPFWRWILSVRILEKSSVDGLNGPKHFGKISTFFDRHKMACYRPRNRGFIAPKRRIQILSIWRKMIKKYIEMSIRYHSCLSIALFSLWRGRGSTIAMLVVHTLRSSCAIFSA
jgi:hypothetical protein